MHMDREILLSKSYRAIIIDLRRAFANVIKKIFTKKLPVDTTKDERPLQLFLAFRLIPLYTNPGLRPIGDLYSYAQVKKQAVKPLYMLCTGYLNPTKHRRY